MTVHPALASALSWLLIMLLIKAIGQRVEPSKVKLTQNGLDIALDVLSLLFALQAALALGEARLFQFLYREFRGSIETALGAAGYAVSSLTLGVIFLVLAARSGWRFAKNDEAKRAWRSLTAFAFWLQLALHLIPEVRDWVDVLSSNVTLPLGKALIAMVNHILDIPHTHSDPDRRRDRSV